MSAAATPVESADIRTVRKYAQLENRRAELDDELKAVKAQLADLEPAVLSYFQRQGMQSTKMEGRTLYLKRELYAGRADGIESEFACEALKSAGLGEFVREGIVTNSLSALLRERDREHGYEQAVPEPLRGVIVANEVHKVGSRRA